MARHSLQAGAWAPAPTDASARHDDSGASPLVSAEPLLTRRELRAQQRASEESGAATQPDPVDDLFRVVPTRRQAHADSPRRDRRAREIPKRPPPTASPSFFLRADASVSKRGRVSQAFALTAMVFAALIAVATSVPAEALLTSNDVAVKAAESKKSKVAGRQQFIVQDGDGPHVERDGFSSSSTAQLALQLGIRAEENSFVNNPRGKIQWPFAVGVHIGDRFGHRNCDESCTSNHQGQDFNPGAGAPVQAIADGVVRVAERKSRGPLGVHVIIEHQIKGQLVCSLYAHFREGSMPLTVGDPVKVAQHVGDTGSTGMSTGDHLHVGILKNCTEYIDPLVWLYENAG